MKIFSEAILLSNATQTTFIKEITIIQIYLPSALRPSSGLLNTMEHNVSETGYVSFLGRGEGNT
jgi:hypothetical protein